MVRKSLLDKVFLSIILKLVREKTRRRGQQVHKSWDGSVPTCTGSSEEANVAGVEWMRAEIISDKIREATGN